MSPPQVSSPSLLDPSRPHGTPVGSSSACPARSPPLFDPAPAAPHAREMLLGSSLRRTPGLRAPPRCHQKQSVKLGPYITHGGLLVKLRPSRLLFSRRRIARHSRMQHRPWLAPCERTLQMITLARPCVRRQELDAPLLVDLRQLRAPLRDLLTRALLPRRLRLGRSLALALLTRLGED